MKDNKYILIMVRTTDGKYGSYHFDDGIWHVIYGYVYSNAESEHFSKFKGNSVEDLENTIIKAAENKRLNKVYK